MWKTTQITWKLNLRLARIPPNLQKLFILLSHYKVFCCVFVFVLYLIFFEYFSCFEIFLVFSFKNAKKKLCNFVKIEWKVDINYSRIYLTSWVTFNYVYLRMNKKITWKSSCCVFIHFYFSFCNKSEKYQQSNI